MQNQEFEHIQKIRNYIKKKKISYGWLKEETGFTTVYISQIMIGRMSPSQKFMRSIVRALEKKAKEDINDFNTLMENIPWKALL